MYVWCMCDCAYNILRIIYIYNFILGHALAIMENQGAMLLTVGRSYVGNDVTPSTLLDRASHPQRY